jgi:hypothetical protein
LNVIDHFCNVMCNLINYIPILRYYYYSGKLTSHGSQIPFFLIIIIKPNIHWWTISKFKIKIEICLMIQNILFSIAGKVFRPERCRLNDKTFEQLMMVKCNAKTVVIFKQAIVYIIYCLIIKVITKCNV